MSEKLGPRTFGRSEELVFLGRQISETRDYSEKFAEEIDEEVRRLIKDAQGRAQQVLVANRRLLDRLVDALIEVETLEGDQRRDLLTSGSRTPALATQSPAEAASSVLPAG
jgi:cell division protease FtsH